MKYLLSTLAIITLVITGCKKEKTSQPVKKPLQLASYTISGQNFTHTTTFEYDNSGYLAKTVGLTTSPGDINQGETYTYQRDANHRLISKTLENDSLYGKAYFYYNSNNQVVRIEQADGNGIFAKHFISYNNNTILLETYNDTQLTKRAEYSYNDSGNIIFVKTLGYYGQSSYNIKDMVYDSNPTPFSLVKGASLGSRMSSFTENPFSENNVLESSTQKSSSTSKLRYSFKYNQSGYPIEITDLETMQTWTYTYRAN